MIVVSVLEQEAFNGYLCEVLDNININLSK
jgi:hypothetical protein